MNDVAALLVAGGIGSVVVALIGALFNRRLNSANYAKIVAELSNSIAADLRADNLALKAEVSQLDKAVDQLRERVGVLIGQLNVAIPLLEMQGIDTAEMRAAIRGGRANGHGS